MTTEKILTTNIRFPKEDLPMSISTVDSPDWIQENEVIYNDQTQKYTIKRLNGVPCGNTRVPVYMDDDGQPQPITLIARELIAGVVQNTELELSQDSPFLSLSSTETEDAIIYELDESISDFLNYENDDVSILDDFILSPKTARTIPEKIGEEEVEEEVFHEVEPVLLYNGFAVNYYNNANGNSLTYQLDSSYDVENGSITINRVDVNDNIIESQTYHYEDIIDGGQANNYYKPDSDYPVEDGTWGPAFDPQEESLGPAVVTTAYRVVNDILYWDILSKYLDVIGVKNDEDLIQVIYHYYDNDGYTTTETVIRDVTENVFYDAGLSLTLGKGLISKQGNQVVLGQYNINSKNLFVVGGGTDDNNRINLFEIQNDGNVLIKNQIQSLEGEQLGSIYIGTEPPTSPNVLMWVKE